MELDDNEVFFRSLLSTINTKFKYTEARLILENAAPRLLKQDNKERVEYLLTMLFQYRKYRLCRYLFKLLPELLNCRVNRLEACTWTKRGVFPLLHAAAVYDLYIGGLSMLLRSGVSINELSTDGRTALDIACGFSCTNDNVKLLLKSGASVLIGKFEWIDYEIQGVTTWYLRNAISVAYVYYGVLLCLISGLHADLVKYTLAFLV
jgi:hypothetical protein